LPTTAGTRSATRNGTARGCTPTADSHCARVLGFGPGIGRLAASRGEKQHTAALQSIREDLRGERESVGGAGTSGAQHHGAPPPRWLHARNDNDGDVQAGRARLTPGVHSRCRERARAHGPLAMGATTTRCRWVHAPPVAPDLRAYRGGLVTPCGWRATVLPMVLRGWGDAPDTWGWHAWRSCMRGWRCGAGVGGRPPQRCMTHSRVTSNAPAAPATGCACRGCGVHAPMDLSPMGVTTTQHRRHAPLV